jgi:hypothetical protein
MALIEIYHTVADMYAVDPDWTDTEAIIEGQWVALESVSGNIYAKRADGRTERVIGVAGDTMSNTVSGTPFAASVVVNPAGATRQTENRVSDFFNETLASGKITVYHGAGKFATDMYATGVTFTVGQQCFVTAAGNLTNANAGTNQVVATCVAPPAAWPSGVPGTDVQGSISLGTYVTFVLTIN